MIAEKRNRILRTVSASFLAAFIGWGVYWLFIAAHYCAPNAEDFSFAKNAISHGLLNSMIDLLVFHYTRYTAAFLYGFNILTFKWVAGFELMPISYFCFMVASFYYFITSIIRAKEARLLLAAYSVLFVLVHYALEPSLPYGLTYMVSTFVYFYPWFFLFLWVGSFLRSVRETNETKRYLLSLLGYFSLLLSFGSSELFISLNAICLAALFISVLIYERSKLKYILPYGVVALSAVSFLLLCPSHKISGETIFADMADRYPGSGFVMESFKSYVAFYVRYLLHPLSLCFILISSLLFSRFEIVKRLKFNFTTSHLVVIFFVTIIGTYLTTWIWFIPKGANNAFPKYIFNSISVFAQLGLYVAIPLYLSAKIFSVRLRLLFPFAEAGFFILLLLLLVFSSNNISTIKKEFDLDYLQDVKNKAEKFYAGVDAVKKSGAKNTVVYFENPKVIPTSIFLDYDVLPNRQSSNWNIAYEDYFAVDEVRMKGDTVFK